MSLCEQLWDDAYWQAPESAAPLPKLNLWNRLVDVPDILLSGDSEFFSFRREEIEDAFLGLAAKQGWHGTEVVEDGEPLPIVDWDSPNLLRLVVDRRRQSRYDETLHYGGFYAIEDEASWFDERAAALQQAEPFAKTDRALAEKIEDGIVSEVERAVYFARHTPSRKRLLALPLGQWPAHRG